MVVEDGVVLGVVFGSSHLFGYSKSYNVGYTLSKWSSGALNTWGGVLRVREFRVTWGLGVVLMEVLELLDWEIISGKVEP